MTINFDERLDLLQRVSRGWLELKKAIESVKRADLERPGAIGTWSIRDLAVHIAAWDEELSRVIQDVESGLPASWPDDESDRDAWNQERVQDFKSIPLDDALDYFNEAHFDLMELLERSSAVSVALVQPTIEHYTTHLADIARWKRSAARS